MSNKFYKPRNEYGDLLTTEKALNIETATRIEQDGIINGRLTDEIATRIAEDKTINDRLTAEADLIRSEFAAADFNLKTEIEGKIDALDNKAVAGDAVLDNKIDTFKTITVKVIENDSMESYFQQVNQNKEMTLEELKVELGRTVYVLKGSDDNISGKNTYEEYVCINPEILDENGRPEMVRLGAVDSILARAEDKTQGFRMGSVELVHGIYDESFRWEDYVIQNLNGKIEPAPGKAVAPYALLQFKQADEKISDNLANTAAEIRSEFAAADKLLASDIATLQEKDTSLDVDIVNTNIRIDEIKQELMGTAEATDYSGSRIDKIEEAIGINGCPKCGREACDHDDPAKDQCTIYCRLKDIETDIEDLADDIQNEQLRAEEVETELQKSIDGEKARAEGKENKLQTLIDDEKSRALASELALQTLIDKEISRAEDKEEKLNLAIKAEEARALASEAGLQKAIDDEKARAEGKEEEFADRIKNITDTIGTHDSSSTQTIWETIDGNHAEAKDLINQNANAIKALETHISTKSSDNVDTVWGSINNSLNRVASLEADIGSKTSNFNNTAWHYIITNDGRLAVAENDIKIHEQSLATVNTVIDTNSKAIEGINKTIGSHDLSSSKTIWQAIDDNLTAIDSINGVIGDRTATTINTDTLWGSIKKSSTDISNNAVNIANNLKQINNNTDRIDAITGRVDVAERVISKHTTDISDISERLIDAENSIEVHNGEINTINATLKEHNNSLTSQGKNLSEAESNITEIYEALDAIHAELGNTDAAATGSSMWAAINDAKNNITLLQTNISLLQTNKSSKDELNNAKEELTRDITAIGNSLGENKNPEYPNSAWSYIVSHDAAINSDNGILNRLSAIESNVDTKAASSDLDISNTRIGELETSKQKIEEDINGINSDIESLDDKINEVDNRLNTQISTLESQVTTLSTQPGVAVINCGLTSVVENGDVWSNSTTIFASSLINFLPNVNDAKNVNFAVTSVRYTTDDTNAPGEQITPEILYYGGVTNDETNNRSAVITFNDFQRKPQSLIVTITYWEENSVINL